MSDKTEEPKKETTVPTYYEAVGRRKESSARVRLYVVKDESIEIAGRSVARGEILINARQADNYFPGETSKKMYLEPFRTTNTLSRFVVSVKVRGGGLSGQLASVIHGISRALDKVDHDKYHPILKKRQFLTRDSRIKERRKAGFAGKARARKQSPKR